MRLEFTPVAGEEVWREHEDGVTALVNALDDRVMQHAAGQKVSLMDDCRDMAVLQSFQQLAAHPSPVARAIADERVTLVNHRVHFVVRRHLVHVYATAAVSTFPAISVQRTDQHSDDNKSNPNW